MYKIGDRVRKVSSVTKDPDHHGFAKIGAYGEVVSLTPSYEPEIQVQFDGETQPEWCYDTEIAPVWAAGDIVGAGPQPQPELPTVTLAELHAVSYDPPGGVTGQKPDRVMMPEPDGGFTWVVYQTESELRKMQPVGTLVTEYFPDAFLGAAAVAWVGNEKHNPGERLHWARGKSTDQIDCEFRHGIDAKRGDGWDTIALPDGRVYQVRHAAAKLWRAAADAQLDIERVNGQVIRRLK